MRMLLFAIFFIGVLSFISGCDAGRASAEDAPAPHAAHAVVSTPKGACDGLGTLGRTLLKKLSK